MLTELPVRAAALRSLTDAPADGCADAGEAGQMRLSSARPPRPIVNAAWAAIAFSATVFNGRGSIRRAAHGCAA
jgi:hypothetical protein